MDITDKKCLVTGGAGFIGSHLVDLLLESNCRVRVIDNLVNGKIENIAQHLKNTEFDFIHGSITDPFDVERALDSINIVFHLACLGVRHSITHPFENHRVNAEGTLLLLEAAQRHRVDRFVYCSSSEVYGTAEMVPMLESHPTRPCTVYGSSKLAGESYARAYYTTYGFPTVIVRPFNTFGPRSHHEGDAGELIPKSIVRALTGEPLLIFGDGTHTRDFTYVQDIARALKIAAEADAVTGDTFNIGSNFEISIKDVARKILALVENTKSEIIFETDRPGDVHRLYANSQKFRDTCQWQPLIDFDQGLVQTINFFRKHPVGLKNLMNQEKGRNWELQER
ncbi:GDP-mannose 4,6-dehydratase [candidate division CSSED10-310 bacterium]|uniref:GDP-mannose 4,6-dehydratase n=1 Tax=candidate division CSSED10-310 bacterium TaxID=2855610 RepID=A0ABV6YUW8_UNCC1